MKQVIYSSKKSLIISITVTPKLLHQIDSAVLLATPPDRRPNRSEWFQKLVLSDLSKNLSKQPLKKKKGLKR